MSATARTACAAAPVSQPVAARDRGACGSAKVAVPTCTADAPASISSTASVPRRHAADADDRQVGEGGVHVVDGPHGDRVDGAARTAPPPPAPSAGRRCSTSMAIPSTVLTSVTASAPASRGRAATSTRSVGVRAELRPDAGGSHAAAAPRASAVASRRVGEEMRAAVEVRAAQVHLDRDDARAARRPAASPPARSRRPCGPRCWRTTRAPARSSRRQVVAQPRRDARALQARRCSASPPVTGCSRGAGLPGPRRRPPATSPRPRRARRVEVAAELVAVARACPTRSSPGWEARPSRSSS